MSNVWKKVGVDMKIKVGEYIRDKYGEIHIVYKVEKDIVYCDKPKMENPPFDTYGCRYYDNRADILKHSFNIIDLIEEGDYVNGRLVLQVDYKNKNVCLLIPFTDTQANTNICWYGNEDIKSVVTKEQFESIKYEVIK